MLKIIIILQFFLTFFPSINFANHNYNYQVQLSEVCIKEDGNLYYSDGEDLSLCEPYGLWIDEFTDNNSIAKQIGLSEGDVIFGYDGEYTLTHDALNKVFNENYSLHDHEILFETYDEESQTFLVKKLNFTIKNQSAYLTDNYESQNELNKTEKNVKNNGDDISANTLKLKTFYNLKTLSNSNDIVYECYDYGNDSLQYLKLGINFDKEEINLNWKFKNKKQQIYKTEIIDVYDPYTILDWSKPEEGKTLDIWFRNPLINDSPWMDEEGLKIRLGNSRYFPGKPEPFSLDPNALVPMDDLSEQYEFIMDNYFGLGFDKVSVYDTTKVNDERRYMSSTILDTATNSDNDLTCIIRKLPSGGNEDFYWPAIDKWESDLPECDPPTMRDFEHSSIGTSKWKNCFGRSFYTDSGEQMMYVGEHNEDGKWHGKGTLCYGRGDRWQGEFVNGFQSRGTIIEVYNEKNTYWDGQWEYNEPTNVKSYPNGKIILMKDLPEDYVYTGPCNENWKIEISSENSQIEETETNEPSHCNKNRTLFCSAQRLVDTCSSYENHNKQLFDNCMKGVEDIGDALKMYGLSDNDIVSGITSCNCN